MVIFFLFEGEKIREDFSFTGMTGLRILIKGFLLIPQSWFRARFATIYCFFVAYPWFRIDLHLRNVFFFGLTRFLFEALSVSWGLKAFFSSSSSFFFFSSRFQGSGMDFFKSFTRPELPLTFPSNGNLYILF